MAAHIILLELEHGQVLQDVVLDACSVLSADPVLGGGPHKALSSVLILHTTRVASKVTVNVAQVDQNVTVIALQHPDAIKHCSQTFS